MPKIEPFEKYRNEYESWFKKNHFVYLSELEAVKHFILPQKFGIEIGVGSGLFSEPLGIKEGVEPSSVMAEKAKERGIKVYSGVAENLPLEKETYDFSLMVTTICFVDDVELSFKEIYRILKPQGTIIMAFVDKNSSIGQVYLKHKHENKFYKEATFFSTEEVLAFLKKTGFQNFQIVQTVFGLSPDISEVQSYKSGYGEGSFVVIKAEKGV